MTGAVHSAESLFDVPFYNSGEIAGFMGPKAFENIVEATPRIEIIEIQS